MRVKKTLKCSVKVALVGILGNFLEIRVVAKDFNITRDHAAVDVSLAEVESKTPRCLAGKTVQMLLRISNQSQFTLKSGLDAPPTPSEHKQAPLNLSYRIYQNHERKHLIAEGSRFFFTNSLEPGGVEYVSIMIACPPEAAVYQLIPDLVQEGVAWKHLVGSNDSTSIPLVVYEDSLNGLSQVYKDARLPPMAPLPRHSKFFDAKTVELIKAARAQLYLGLFWYFEDGEFYQLVNAGSQYPMVWTRDMATVGRGLATFQGEHASNQHHWGELFLKRLRRDGIVDWFATSRQNPQSAAMAEDKNSILTDQELWTIQAILVSIEQGRLSPAFLRKELAGSRTATTVLEQMFKALEWLMAHHWQASSGCLMTGHVADWGDVGLLGTSSADSTKMQGPKVCGLYAQSLLFDVLQRLERVLESGNYWGEDFLVAFGGVSGLKAKVASFVEQKLWQNDAGFYRIHIHVDDYDYGAKTTAVSGEDAIFALGGHVLALESGLIPDSKKPLILQAIDKKAKEAAFGAVLVPSYPAKTFENPIMDEAYEYQNGGIWDWYAPRAIVQLFPHNPDAATKYWQGMVARIHHSDGFYEWYHLNGNPGAGRHYQASAASFLWAWQSLTH